MTIRLITVGHGTLAQDELVKVLRDAGIESLVDVRTAPGSRRFPHFRRQAMEEWLPDAGIAYRWEPRLGGLRRPSPESPNIALRNSGFRAYTDHDHKNLSKFGFRALEQARTEQSQRLGEV